MTGGDAAGAAGAAGSAARSVAATVGTSVSGAAISLAREVPGTVALATGVGAFATWVFVSRLNGRAVARKQQSRRRSFREQLRVAVSPDKGPAASAVPASDSMSDEQEDGTSEESEGFCIVGQRETDMQSVDSSDPDGTTEARAEAVFTHVLMRNTPAVVAALEEGVVDVNAYDSYGNTLLVLAAQTNSASLAMELIERGADVNAQNWRGQTALHFAMSFGYHSMADLLLARGADKTIRNDWGMTPEEGIMDFAGGGELMSAHPDILPRPHHPSGGKGRGSFQPQISPGSPGGLRVFPPGTSGVQDNVSAGDGEASVSPPPPPPPPPPPSGVHGQPAQISLSFLNKKNNGGKDEGSNRPSSGKSLALSWGPAKAKDSWAALDGGMVSPREGGGLDIPLFSSAVQLDVEAPHSCEVPSGEISIPGLDMSELFAESDLPGIAPKLDACQAPCSGLPPPPPAAPPPPPPPLGKGGPPPPPPPPGMASRKGEAEQGSVDGIAKSWEVIEQFRVLNRSKSVGKGNRRSSMGSGRDRGAGEEIAVTSGGNTAASGRNGGGGEGAKTPGGGGGEGVAHKVHEELQAKSSYMKQVLQDRERYGKMLLDLAAQIRRFTPKTAEHVDLFLCEVEKRLALLSDERMVLKDDRLVEVWPERRIDCMREAVAKKKTLLAMVRALDVQRDSWCAKSNVRDELYHVEDALTAVRAQLDQFLRDQDECKKRLNVEKVPFDWSLVQRIHRAAVALAKYAMSMILTSTQSVDPHPDAVAMIEQALRFSFKCHQFAGGFDNEATQLFVSLSTALQSMQEALQS